MNYKKLYNKIIENRQQNPIDEGYTENHHILPECLGGLNNLHNMVRLSTREHFICHYLLAKMYKKESFEWYKMNNAFMKMKCESYNQDRYYNSRLYEALRGNFSEVMSFAQKGEKNSQFGTCWICNIENKENKKIPKQDLELWETKGWVNGRSKWKEIDDRKKKQENKARKEKEIVLEKERKIKHKILENNRIKEEAKISYNLFREIGFENYKEQTNYTKSFECLIMYFRRHAENYESKDHRSIGDYWKVNQSGIGTVC